MAVQVECFSILRGKNCMGCKLVSADSYGFRLRPHFECNYVIVSLFHGFGGAIQLLDVGGRSCFIVLTNFPNAHINDNT